MFDFTGLFIGFAITCFALGVLFCAVVFGLYELSSYLIHHIHWV